MLFLVIIMTVVGKLIYNCTMSLDVIINLVSAVKEKDISEKEILKIYYMAIKHAHNVLENKSIEFFSTAAH